MVIFISINRYISMFRKMRRFGQELKKEECEEILIKRPRGVLAILGDNEYPYSVPLSHVYANGKIYFHGAKEGHKKEAIEKNSKCSYCVLDEGIKAKDSWWYTFKSVIVFGKIKTLDNNNEKIKALTFLGDKFFPTHEDTTNEIDRFLDKTEVFELTIEHMSGKKVKEK